MTNHNIANERIERQYLPILPAQGHSGMSINALAKAIPRFEAFARHKDFKTLHIR